MIYALQLQEHFSFDLFSTLAKMSFTMIVRTQSDNISWPICTVICESY